MLNPQLSSNLIYSIKREERTLLSEGFSLVTQSCKFSVASIMQLLSLLIKVAVLN